MNFKEWINEAILPSAIKDWNAIRKGAEIYLDGNGKIVVDIPKYGEPYIRVSPKAKSLTLQHMSPQSKAFRNIVLALKTKYPDIGSWETVIYGVSHATTGNEKYYRDVAYWMKQPLAEFNIGGIPKFVYHGTSTNLWYGGIKQQGLLPRTLNKMGAAGSYGSQGDSLSYADRIYLAVHPDHGTRFASQQASEKHGGRPLILKIDTTSLHSENFVGDEDSRSDNPVVSARKTGMVGYRGRIPPSAIKPFIIGERIETKNRISWKWTPFEDVPMAEHPLLKRMRQESTWFSYSDSPYYWALLDAGIIDRVEGPRTESGHSTGMQTIFKKQLNDEEIRYLIKNSSWVQNADRIIKDTHDFGMKGIKAMNYVRTDAVQTDKQKKIIDMMVESGMLQDNNGYYKVAYFTEKPAIALAKLMKKSRLDYRDLIEIINSIPKK